MALYESHNSSEKDIFILTYILYLFMLILCDMNQKLKFVLYMKHSVISHVFLNKRLSFNIFLGYTCYKLPKKGYVAYRYNYICYYN